MRKIHAVVLVLFGWMMIGADDCGLWKSTSPTGPGNTPPPLIASYCQTDPPLGCVGLCITVDMGAMGPPPPTPSTTCDAGGDLAKQFVSDVETILVCDETMASYVVFPPYFSITPQVVQTGTCAQPPALPNTMPLSAFMGFGQ
jgi:hypothetical protein